MNKIQKISIILQIALINILLLSIRNTYPISIIEETAVFYQIPIEFWIILIISSILLFIISFYSKNIFVSIICAIFYFFLIESYGLYFVSHPTFGDIGSSTIFQELLASITNIGPAEISIEYYFQWPVYFIFSKIFSTILGLGPILTLNLGFIFLFITIPIYLAYFFKKKTNIEHNYEYFIILALYIIISFNFLNDQFVPQFIALIYLIILYGFYIRYRDSNDRILLIFTILIYTLLVFSHAFMFLFFLIALIFEKLWYEYISKEKNVLSYELIMLFLLIPFTYIPIYFSFIRTARVGESWRIFESITSQRTGTNNIQVQFLYNYVSESLDFIFSNLTKVIVFAPFLILTLGFFFHMMKKREILDLSIIISSFSWFVLGLFNLVLGQRSLQVVSLALLDYFKNSQKFFSILTKILIIFVLISPYVFVSNTLINQSLEGERLIQDTKDNYAGKFFDSNYLGDDIIIISAQNSYPTGIESNIIRISPTSIINEYIEFKFIKYIIDSPKLKLRYQYLNHDYPLNYQNSVLYSSNKINIVSTKY